MLKSASIRAEIRMDPAEQSPIGSRPSTTLPGTWTRSANAVVVVASAKGTIKNNWYPRTHPSVMR